MSYSFFFFEGGGVVKLEKTIKTLNASIHVTVI